MKRLHAITTTDTPPAAPPRVSLRTMYADAMREVMANPRKAIDEFDPPLAALALLIPAGSTPDVQG